MSKLENDRHYVLWLLQAISVNILFLFIKRLSLELYRFAEFHGNSLLRSDQVQKVLQDWNYDLKFGQ